MTLLFCYYIIARTTKIINNSKKNLTNKIYILKSVLGIQ